MNLSLKEMRTIQILAHRWRFPESKDQPDNQLDRTDVMNVYVKMGNAIVDFHKKAVSNPTE